MEKREEKKQKRGKVSHVNEESVRTQKSMSTEIHVKQNKIERHEVREKVMPREGQQHIKRNSDSCQRKVEVMPKESKNHVKEEPK